MPGDGATADILSALVGALTVFWNTLPVQEATMTAALRSFWGTQQRV